MRSSNSDGSRDRLSWRDVGLFMPEGIGALFILVVSPVFGLGLIQRHLWLSASCLGGGLCLIGWIAYQGFRRRSKWMVYVSILLTFGLWFSIDHWVGLI